MIASIHLLLKDGQLSRTKTNKERNPELADISQAINRLDNSQTDIVGIAEKINEARKSEGLKEWKIGDYHNEF